MHRTLPLAPALALLVIGLSGFATFPAQAQNAPDGALSIEIPPVDLDAVRVEDAERERLGLPPRFAIPNPVLVTPATHGAWSDFDADTRLWRLEIASPGAQSLNLGFGRYFMPTGGQMIIAAADGSDVLRPFSEADNEEHGQLWTPVVRADRIVVEVTIPRAVEDALELELTSINVGYRGFGKDGGDKSGWCNIDVVCPEGDDWRAEIRSVGVISTGGSTFCTGFMVNNTGQDERPFFMTANHCGISSGNAASLVVYWNFESPTCGQQGGGSLSQWQNGSFWRAAYSSSDFTLVELDDDPNPAWNVTFAGWDRSTADPTSAVAIHHPNTDEKSISFEYQPCTTTSYLGTSVPGDGTHVRVTDWDLGTTEPGSSGSPLFDQNHHAVGQLHGGYAACGNNDSDWYGRFSRSWTGGGSNSTRLSNWLDPLSTGAVNIDTLDPNAGLKVTPNTNFASSGPAGGPFAPGSTIYTLENQGDVQIEYGVTKNVNWLSIANASGFLDPQETVQVTVSINSLANSLGIGAHSGTVSLVNITDHRGDALRTVDLQVGIPSAVYSFAMNSDPGWSVEGSWSFGQPAGSGGQRGGPDPTSGHTGTNVYGYNLAGDYQNNLSERHLTSMAIDCSNLVDVTLKFWRWLGVEHPDYDHAYVRVSNDGTSWTTVWQNTQDVADAAWVQQEFDISAVADGQATVYLRWTMGTTDFTNRYCGWNIDDVEIWGIESPPFFPGDLNCDGLINSGDIPAFVLAVTDPPGYQATYPGCDRSLADVNDDGLVNAGDIPWFVDLLTGG